MTATKILYRARSPQPRPPQFQSSTGSLEALSALLGYSSPTTRVPVNERTASGLVGVDAAVMKISNAVAQMMTAAQTFKADGRTPSNVPLVVSDPCVGYDSFTFWKEAVSTGLMRGNWVGIKCDYDDNGFAQQVLPVPFDAVNGYYDSDGYVVYEIAGEPYTPDEIVHIRCGTSVPGEIMSWGAVEKHRRALSGMLDQQGMAQGIWREGGIPSGVVQLDVDFPTREQTSTVKEGWIGVLDGRRTVAVTGKKMTFTPVTWSADDAQFLESRQFSIAESALMFGLRPEDLGSSFGASTGAMSYGNRTDDALQRIVDSYVPSMLPIEQAWSRLLPGKSFVKGDPEVLLRGSTRDRLEVHLLAQQAGIESVDESREIESKPPLPKADTPPPPEQPALPPAPPPELTTGGDGAP